MSTPTIPQWTLGDRLAKARDVAGLSTYAIAELLGVSRNTVTNWETGSTNPKRYAVEAWARATGVDVAWLLDELPGASSVRSRWDSPGVRRMRPDDGLAVAA